MDGGEKVVCGFRYGTISFLGGHFVHKKEDLSPSSSCGILHCTVNSMMLLLSCVTSDGHRNEIYSYNNYAISYASFEHSVPRRHVARTKIHTGTVQNYN